MPVNDREIQYEVVLNSVLNEADLLHDQDGVLQRQRLEAASAQLAIALAAGDEQGIPNIESLYDRIILHRDIHDPNRTGKTISMYEVLNDRELAFLPAARTVVGLTYQAARFPSATQQPVPIFRK